MDMSSSDDEYDVKPTPTKLVPIQKKQDMIVKTPAKMVPQPSKPENEEIVLNFVEFEKNFDFESVFLQSSDSNPDQQLFGDNYKKLKSFKIENCVFSD